VNESSIELSVVLPAYREADNLRALLPRLHREVAKLTESFEIIVVDTVASMDDSRDVCEESGARHINRQGSDSYGSAVKTGIQAARGRHAIFMDADGSHPPEFLARLWEQRDAATIVIASRYIDGGSTDNPRTLVWMSRLVNLTFSKVLGLRIRDVSNSLKLYRTSDLQSLELVCQNLDIIEEILVKLIRSGGHTVLEIPFSFQKRWHGASKRKMTTFILSYFGTLFRLRFGSLR
jgi:dolichol-phosphate mannosyltransferase